MRRQRVTRIIRGLAVAGLAAVALVLVRDRLPAWSDVSGALTNADHAWLGVAVGAELFSMAMFARQQRRLLRAFGVPISLPRAGAITWSRSAIAISLPAGSALSAGWAFRQFRASGASRATAAAVMVLSALMSLFALGALYVTGLLASLIGPITALSTGAIAALGVGGSLAVFGTGLALSRSHANHLRSRGTGDAEPDPGPSHRAPQEPHPRPHPLLDRLGRRWPRLAGTRSRLAEVRESAREVQRRHWALAFAAAALNWLADLGCLAAAARAFELPVTVAELGLIYLGVQIVRQIPLTPGGVGVIEASLLAGLVASGAPEAAAAATVVVYRLLSCWLVIPIGALAWAGLRRPHRPGDLADGERVAVEGDGLRGERPGGRPADRGAVGGREAALVTGTVDL